MASAIKQVNTNTVFKPLVQSDNAPIGEAYTFINEHDKLYYGLINQGNIIKIGYNCEPRGQAECFPIYLNPPAISSNTEENNGFFTNSFTKKILIGKSCTYEADYTESIENKLEVTGFAVPIRIEKLDDDGNIVSVDPFIFTMNYVIGSSSLG